MVIYKNFESSFAEIVFRNFIHSVEVTCCVETLFFQIDLSLNQDYVISLTIQNRNKDMYLKTIFALGTLKFQKNFNLRLLN